MVKNLWPLLFWACTPSLAFGVSHYNVTLLPAPAGSTAIGVTASSALGIVGGSQTVSPDGNPLNNASQAILWQGSNMITLPAPEDYLANAVGINSSGDVIGVICNANTQYTTTPVLWHDGQLQVLDTGSFSGGTVYSINSSGAIAGYLYDYNPRTQVTQAAVWQNGQLTTLSGFDAALAINDSGQVLVVSHTTTSQLTSIWFNGALTPITSLYGTLLNNAGDVAGDYALANGAGPGVGLWKNGSTTFLPNLPGDQMGFANGINDADVIVGSCYGSNGGATLWEDGQVYNLNDLIPPDSGWRLDAAGDIDNSGQIIGIGLFNDQEAAFLLTPVGDAPVPEPASLTLLVMGAGVLLRRRR